MNASEFLKKNITLGIVGVVSAVLATRYEPFKSHLLLAVLMAAGVGVLAGIIEVGLRKIATKTVGRHGSPK